MAARQILMALAGFSAGTAVAGGIFTLIVGMKIVPRFAQCTRTAHRIRGYENCIVWGGILGNIWNVFGLGLPLGTPGLAIFGLVSGVYVGAWAMALADIVDAIPIFMRRISLKRGVGLLIAGLAFGRTLGGLLHFYFRW